MAQPIWNTPQGSLGSFPSLIHIDVLLVAIPVLPGTVVNYDLLSGTLPSGLEISSYGLIFGTPSLVDAATTSTFTARVTDNLGNLRDRTFSITIIGSAIPQITTPGGTLLSQYDSVWTQLQIEYSNPDPNNIVIVELKEGALPPGLKMSDQGLISGYPLPPTDNISMPMVTTFATSAVSSTNSIICFSTNDFFEGRAVTFSGATFSTINIGTTYYIKNILTPFSFTISQTQFGNIFSLTDDTGVMDVTLPITSVGEPTVRTYSFTLQLTSNLGGNFVSYNIDIINQRAPVPIGPGKPANARIPTILNTRPLNIDITGSDQYYGYYILPPVPPTQYASIGTVGSSNFFAFKVIGHDFDGNTLTYSYSGLPAFLNGDPNTGWITGIPSLVSSGISKYTFKVGVYKTAYPGISSAFFNFTFNLSYDISGIVTWVTGSDLGTLFNGQVSSLKVGALSDIALEYRIVDGALPPNMLVSTDGEILGRVPFQPTSVWLSVGESTVFTFTVEAFSTQYPVVSSTKEFTLTVLQEFSEATDIVYCKAAPSVHDRVIIGSLLTNTTLIPDEMLYRSNDVYFGKATNVTYEHMYGAIAANLEKYLQAVMINHYWRNITLGEIKTAVAKNDVGEIVYEVVYSEVIDNLINNEISSTTTGENDDDPPYVIWNTPINLNLGPWYTSITDLFTSYELLLGQAYYTSLTAGYIRTVYPNSLLNMRNRVATVVGQEYNSKLLPLWMTSQQSNGGTLGYTQAWVICHTKPGFANIIKNNIQTANGTPASALWPHTLNEINFKIDRITVDKSETYNYIPVLDIVTMNDPVTIIVTEGGKDITTEGSPLPSASPTPDPLDSEDFYVLFPRQTILPDTLE